MFFNVGGYEILVIAIVALIVVGPEQLPVVMRKVGRYAAQARRMATNLRQEFVDGLEGTELQDLAKLKDLTRLDAWADLGDPDRSGRGTDDDPIVPRGFAQSQAALEAEAASGAVAEVALPADTVLEGPDAAPSSNGHRPEPDPVASEATPSPASARSTNGHLPEPDPVDADADPADAEPVPGPAGEAGRAPAPADGEGAGPDRPAS